MVHGLPRPESRDAAGVYAGGGAMNTRDLYMKFVTEHSSDDMTNIALYLSGKRSFRKYQEIEKPRYNTDYAILFDLQLLIMQGCHDRMKKVKYLKYEKYLETREWKLKAYFSRSFADHRCMICNTFDVGHVHHNTYNNKPFEELRDLIYLCPNCHAIYHDKQSDSQAALMYEKELEERYAYLHAQGDYLKNTSALS
jgi:hypothetical protein